MGVNGAKGEAATVLFKHLSLVLIGSVGLCSLFGNRGIITSTAVGLQLKKYMYSIFQIKDI